MNHRLSTGHGRLWVWVSAWTLGTVIASVSALAIAQTSDAGISAASAVLAQQQYDRDLATCNTGLPAPQRDSCIREAGQRFDRVRGLPASPEAQPSGDGRATVMAPSSASSVLRGSTTTTTSDGRATVVVPGTIAQ